MRRAALLVCVTAAVAAAGCLNDFEEPSAVHVANLDLSPHRVLAQEVVLNVTTVLDNRGGGASPPIRLVAKAYAEDTGFLVAENESHVGEVAGETTMPVSQFVKVPREGSVRIDVVLYEDEQATRRAGVSARNLGTLQPEVVDTGLRVSEVDFIVREVVRNDSVRIQTDLYVTNEGGDASENLRVQVKAREVTTRLVADVQWVDTTSIAAGATVVRSANLTVPDGYNYVFEIATWRGEVIVARHEGHVQLAPTFEKPKDQEVVITDPNVRDFVSRPDQPGSSLGGDAADGGDGAYDYSDGPGESSAVPATGAALALALVGGVALAARRWAR